MKKKAFRKAVSIIFALVAILAIVCAITVTGGGFLDLSNIARVICISIAVVCGILAVVMWRSVSRK